MVEHRAAADHPVIGRDAVGDCDKGRQKPGYTRQPQEDDAVLVFVRVRISICHPDLS